MTDEFFDQDASDLSGIRDALQPLSGAADRVITGALEIRGTRRGLRAAAVGIAVAAVAAALTLTAIRERHKGAPRIRMGNVGSVIFVETGRGERWAISGTQLAGRKSILIAKGELR